MGGRPGLEWRVALQSDAVLLGGVDLGARNINGRTCQHRACGCGYGKKKALFLASPNAVGAHNLRRPPAMASGGSGAQPTRSAYHAPIKALALCTARRRRVHTHPPRAPTARLRAPTPSAHPGQKHAARSPPHSPHEVSYLVRVGHVHDRPILQGRGQADEGKGVRWREAAVQADYARLARVRSHDFAQARQAAAGTLSREEGGVVDGDGRGRCSGGGGRRGPGALGVGRIGRVKALEEEERRRGAWRGERAKGRGCFREPCPAPTHASRADPGSCSTQPAPGKKTQGAVLLRCAPWREKKLFRRRCPPALRFLAFSSRSRSLTFHRHGRVDGHVSQRVVGLCVCWRGPVEHAGVRE